MCRFFAKKFQISDFIDILPRGHYMRFPVNDVISSRYRAVVTCVIRQIAMQRNLLPIGSSVQHALKLGMKRFVTVW
jgi:hypothetical protein